MGLGAVSKIVDKLNAATEEQRRLNNLKAPIIKTSREVTGDDVTNLIVGNEDINVVTEEYNESPENATPLQTSFEQIRDQYMAQNVSSMGKKVGNGLKGVALSINEDPTGNGICELVALGGTTGTGKQPKSLVVCGGSVLAIETSRKAYIEKCNARIGEIATIADSIPAVLGTPSGGFLGLVLKVVSVLGVAGQLGANTGPLAKFTKAINEFVDDIGDATGIDKFSAWIKKGPIGKTLKFFEELPGRAAGIAGDIFDDVFDFIKFDEIFKETPYDKFKAYVKDVLEASKMDLTDSELRAMLTDEGISAAIAKKGLAGEFRASLKGYIEDVASGMASDINHTFRGLISQENVGAYTVQMINGDVEGAAKNLLQDNVPVAITTYAVLGDKLKEAETIEDMIKGIAESEASAADKEKAQNEIDNVVKEMTLISDFHNNLESVIASNVLGDTEATYIQDLSVPFTFVSSVEELELEMSGRLAPKGSRPVSKIVIHATESFTNSNFGAEEINDIHNKLGDEGIQYHYVIRRDGRLQRGLSIEESGKHTGDEGIDKNSIGIVMVGGIDSPTTEQPFQTSSSSFTRVQYNTLEQFLTVYYHNFPGGSVYGHNDLDNSELDPYFDVQDYILSLFGKVNTDILVDIDDTESEDFEDLNPPTENEEVVEEDIDAEIESDEGKVNDNINVTTKKVLDDIKKKSVIYKESEKYKVYYRPQQSKDNKPVDWNEFKAGSNIAEDIQYFANTISENLFVNSGYRDPHQNVRAKGAPRRLLSENESVTEARKKSLTEDRGPESNTPGLSNGSPHMYGLAVDVGIRGFENNRDKVAQLVKLAKQRGFTQIGISSTFIHMDKKDPDRGFFYKDYPSKNKSTPEHKMMVKLNMNISTKY
jgi:N-acetylmuramoyl-L-alanine amidase